MFVVLLTFAENRDQASHFVEGHDEWIRRGFDDGSFVLVGNLEPQIGGAIVAHDMSLSELQRRVDDDPFVAEGVVRAQILEIAPSRTDARLQFLIAR